MEDLRDQMGGSSVEHLTIGAAVFDSVAEFNTSENYSNTGLAMKTKESVSLQQDSQESSPVITSNIPLDYIPQDPQVPVGTHCMLELYGCPADLLNDIEFIKQTLADAAAIARSTLLERIAHQFHPQGVTALALLAESHISIHTWPENGYIAADVFTCGEHTTPVEACEFIARAFKSSKHLLMKLPRGKFSPTVQPHIEII
ncbi:S-adenosylmethionine decarboxylase proenzyme [Calothrix sp. NIES-4101]|uniref:adenosylmethionine decarboxylase n=1 Tax=Calothrix sp. UHCC 0171 TaxID=3110245 RepID=UPI000B608832|nr:adenosylmethionine decarboxylase [Calothrix sp. UHCC 0171]MEA5570994.1 adenosylmethionine decarboxylase [Calothrix sp. UHCC 0171]BAZ37276.1 S-adenosylmethionine decarboxylase proenzyme [Calothrix sp. NIES-4101]